MSETDVVNVTHLIRLVRERPVLWDRTLTELYKNRRLTQQAWLEICEHLVPGFPELPEPDKKAAERSMMGKWANLRDNWLRYWRKRQDLLHSGAPLDSLRKYIHHDRMIFLSKVYDTEAWEEVEQIEVEVDLPSPESMSPLSGEPPQPCPLVPWDLSNTVNPQEYMEWKRLAPNLIYRSIDDVPDLIPVTLTSTIVNQARSSSEPCNNFLTNNFPMRVPLRSPCREEVSIPTPPRPTIINTDFMEMKAVVEKLQQISEKLEKAASEDSHDLFGRHVASLLRDLPASKVDSMKRKILKSLHHAKVLLEEENGEISQTPHYGNALLEEQNAESSQTPNYENASLEEQDIENLQNINKHSSLEDQIVENLQSVCSTSPGSELPLTVSLRLTANNEASLIQPEQSISPPSEIQHSSDDRQQNVPEAQPVRSRRKKRKNRKHSDTEILLPTPGSRRIIKKLKPYDV